MPKHHPAGGRDRRARRQGDLPQRLRHRSRHHTATSPKPPPADAPDGGSGTEPSTCPDQRRQPGAQFRTRARGPGQPAGGARPVGLRRSYRLRPARSGPATRMPDPRHTQASARAHAHARRPCGHPLMNRPRRRPRHRRTLARRRPDTSKPPPQTPTEPPTGNTNPISWELPASIR